jgi:hypothetical protein
MKTPYYFLLAMALMAFTGCGDKNNTEQQNVQNSVSANNKTALTRDVINPPLIDGTLKFINGTNDIVVNLSVRVSDGGYKYGNAMFAFEQGTSKLRGIAFNYYHSANYKRCDAKPFNNTITISDTLTNIYNWKEKDSVRIISLNEKDITEFLSLRPYFDAKLEKFKYKKDLSEARYSGHDDEWNSHNNSNQVNVCDYKGQHFIPRVTKDDGVLSISR